MSARIRATKQYKGLRAVGLDDTAALRVLGHAPAVDTNTQTLLDAGFTPEQAASILGGQFATPTAVAQVVAPAPTQVTSKDLADNLVAQSGLSHGKGRVYATGEILTAAARVLKTGTPEIVRTSGKGKTPAVVIFREDSGDVAIQNLYNPVG